MIMKRPTTFKLSLGIYMLLFLFLAACTGSREAPPFPKTESEFKQPLTKKFEFTKEDTIIWKTKKTTPFSKLPTKKFSWDQLAAKPIDIGLPIPYNGRGEEKPFSLESLPSMPFNLDSLPQATITIKTKVLGDPEIVEAGPFTDLPGLSRGVVRASLDMGLPTEIFSLLKDRNGMLWMGMQGQIARYDSNTLEIYALEQGIASATITGLFEDSKGRLWISNSLEGTTILDFEAKLIYEITSDLPNISGNSIIEAADGKFWLSNLRTGYDIIDLEEKLTYRFTPNEGLLGIFNVKLHQDKKGLIWLPSSGGVNIIDLESGKNMQLTTENGLPGLFTAGFFEDNQGRLWIANQGGGIVLNPERTSLSIYSFGSLFQKGSQITGVFQDSSGKYWFGGGDGVLYLLDENMKQIEKINLSNRPSQAAIHYEEDASGQVWTVMPQGGLYKIDLHTARPGNFTIEDGLTSNSIWHTLEARDGKIWIGGYEGIDIYDPETRTIKHLGETEGLVNDRNSRLNEDSEGRIWAVGSRFGVSIIDPEKQTIQQLTNVQGLETNIISDVLEDTNGRFWMGADQGEVLLLDEKKSELNYYLPTRAEEVFQNNVIHEDTNGNIWIAVVGAGIQRINTTTNERVFLNTEGGLLSNQVFSIALDEKNNVWAAMDFGVQYIDLKTKEITTFTTDEGLAANDVYAIAVHDGEIFAGTSRGLTILRPQTESDEEKIQWTVKTIGKGQGLNLLDFSENSFTFDRNNRFWAGVQGEMLTVMNPLELDSTTTSTNITGINILDKQQTFVDYKAIQSKRAGLDAIWAAGSNDSIIENKNDKTPVNRTIEGIEWKTVEGPYDMPVELVLPYTQNYLSFNYNSANFTNQDQVYYRYILEGIDKNWSPISQEKVSENYRDLPPGSYSFKVASKGFDDVWSEPSSFSFTILPPWWQSWWAYGIYLVMLVLLGYRFHLYQKARTLKKVEEEARQKELEQAKEIKKAYAELKATQTQLIQAEKMASLGELTAGIAHEIQNPLNFVNNFSEVNRELIEELKEEQAKTKKDRDLDLEKELLADIDQNLEKISHHGKRADSIVKGMLQHSRASSGEKDPTDINLLADEYLRLAYHGLRAKDKSFNATMETHFDEKIGKIAIIPQDMGRVILNLITNAFHAVQERKKLGEENYQPTVIVSTKKEKNGIEIEVKDNGNGIPKKIIQRIFEPFFTTKPSGRGTGLGLSMSYEIVTKGHNGELKVASTEGEGTTFTIVLPEVKQTKKK